LSSKRGPWARGWTPLDLLERPPKVSDRSEARSKTPYKDWLVSTPAEGGSDMGQDRIDDMRIVGDAKLVRDRQE
jgi:hypothetical protein